MISQECALNLDRDGKEIQPHGTLSFPCAEFSEQYRDTVEDSLPWHWHEDMEVIYLKTGKLKLQIPGEIFHLNAGELFFINSNILHCAIAEPYCEIQSLVFSPLLIIGSENSIFATKYLIPLIDCDVFDGCLFQPSEPSKMTVENNFLAAFQAISSSTIGYEFIVREKLSQICLSLYEKYEHEIKKGYVELDSDNLRIRKMLDYIHTHYSDHLKLSTIASSAAIGERECLRCFQRVIQISPMQYVLKHRIMQGAAMLTQSLSASISEISMQCGFDSPSNFSQMFKRFFNCSPREYRNEVKSHT